MPRKIKAVAIGTAALVLSLAVLAAIGGLTQAVAQHASARPHSAVAQREPVRSVQTSVVASDHAAPVLLGVFSPSTASLNAFTHALGRQPDLILTYSTWGGGFPSDFAFHAGQRGAKAMVDLDPGHESLQRIASGEDDAYLRKYASQVKAFGQPVVIAFAHEMNGAWYPWGYTHVAPATYVAAWRHVVTTFRHAGARNVKWMWEVNRNSPRTARIHNFWPGPSYVDWVGISGYYFTRYDTFSNMFGGVLREVRALTSKPVLIAETAAGPTAGKAAKIPNLFAGIRKNHLLGLVWFDVHQHNGLYHQDWRLETDAKAVRAFRSELSRQGG